MFRKESLKSVLALLMIAVGLAGFLWEFTIVDNEFYTVTDTHYGNRFELHYDSAVPPDNINYVNGKDLESALRKLISGRAMQNEMYYSVNSGEPSIPGIEWLVEPTLPEGCAVERAYWVADWCGFHFGGEANGIVEIYGVDKYFQMMKVYREQKDSDPDVQWYTLGTCKVKRSESRVSLFGMSNGFCFYAGIKTPDGTEFTDEQIRQLGVRIAAPESWEVGCLVLINVLRGICLATAAAGVVLLAVAALKRKNRIL